MKHLFAYGTLMCSDIMADVSGLEATGSPGTLRGYRRLRVKGECYPALLQDAAGCVEGVVYREIPQAAWTCLDRFEGEMYIRETVQVQLADGAFVAARTYVVHEDFTSCLENIEWDRAAFLLNGKERFCRSYRGIQNGFV